MSRAAAAVPEPPAVAPATPAAPVVAAPVPPEAYLAPGYQVVEHLNRSRALDVYDVWSEARDCRCVAKTPRPDRLDHRNTCERLEQEGRLLARFTHPHIVRAYEVLHDPQPIVILETLTGHTLGHVVARRRRRLALADIAFLGMHLCSAIHYLHGNDILHLDLKPSNVASDGGRAKVLDLSLARRPGPARQGAGTRHYMAPEQARGEDVSAATDVWGIGATLYEATTGLRPFASFEGNRYEQLERAAGRVREHRRVPLAFDSLIASCLDPDPAERPTVAGLSEVLDEMADAGA